MRFLYTNDDTRLSKKLGTKLIKNSNFCGKRILPKISVQKSFLFYLVKNFAMVFCVTKSASQSQN